ncbi:hypothetical protein SERLA73DRAFT_192018 [Serpula lacrymans var. lacrymans S7.3]|uniref:FYVE-type domain-containing protein n=2 Tax=Serpula lacrymans var. lacrymans TaxID=341189 RepID=F8QIT0_SERL3|nr:uncharacterized protein SERLADRAFT_479080 [Serpula lacrymans var. lacrymans S7.9]EGN91802.1 hypothetical protein SERLA73DRAFT_192018 [Serpula lacrymans var. lacrymans S7.3]EGO19537.1 hypothetical protein SERLADRAFT_479080 [Serpula lacrymans var. lacrymans S7.9]
MSVLAATFVDFASRAHSCIASIVPLSPEDQPESGSSTRSLPSNASPRLSLSIPTRTNEHLAVLLPKDLWKPDSLASNCDTFFCRVRFSVLERRHHCRKCGGVFCSQCTTRSTPLLDASNLDFLHPPRNVPIFEFESSSSPVIMGKVCDGCWDQIHGCSSPKTPDLVPSTPVSVRTSPFVSGTSSLSSSVCASPITHSATMTPIIRIARSSSQLSNRNTLFPSALTSSIAEMPERSFGELDAYPLRRSSAICKATGGGRWEPKQSPPKHGLRIPGCKASFELEMEREEEEQRRRRSNPIVRDGEFQYRFQGIPESVVLARSPFQLSTF